MVALIITTSISHKSDEKTVEINANILAFDCAASSCSAAVWQAGSIAAHRFEAMARGQAEALVPMIEAVMSEAGADYGDLDVIAVTIGPGAFTGLRIGLATARALGLAAGTPLYGVTTFDAVLAGASQGENEGQEAPNHNSVLVALETKRADIYGQMFSAAASPVSDPAAIDEDDLPAFAAAAPPPVLVIGDAGARALGVLLTDGIDAQLSAAPAYADARTVARLAAEIWRPGGDQTPLEPLYLRPPDATLPAKPRRQGAS